MVEGSSSTTGPFLSAALLCEKVLNEVDGVKSAIRIVDRVTVSPIVSNSAADMPPLPYQIMLLLKFKSGQARGTQNVGIQLIKPSQDKLPQRSLSVLFEGEEDRGVDIVSPVMITLDQVGIYWFRITINDVFLTKIPLRVIYLPQTMQTVEPTSNQ